MDSAHTQQNSSRVPVWIVAAAFGPYLLPSQGVRLEHLVVYLLIPWAALFLLMRRRPALGFWPFLCALGLLGYAAVWTLLVTVFGPPTYAHPAKIVAHIENYVQPVAVILIVVAFAGSHAESQIATLLEQVCKVLIAFLLVNAAIALASVFVDLTWVIRYFVGNPAEDGLTVSSRAASMGRHSGIFNQPIESGLTYSLGLLAWTYLARRKPEVGLWDYAVLPLLFLGGILSISKVFILGGVPLFLIYSLCSGSVRRFLTWRLGITSVVSGALGLTILDQWEGFARLVRLLNTGTDHQANLVALYTAGRFGREHSFVKNLFTRVWEEAPLYGLGFGATTTLDNAYLEYFVRGGVTTLVAYLALLLVVGILGWRQHAAGREEGRFLLLLTVFVAGAGLGAPVVTINRFSTVFWVIWALLCLLAYATGRSPATPRHPPSRARPKSLGGGRFWDHSSVAAPELVGRGDRCR